MATDGLQFYDANRTGWVSKLCQKGFRLGRPMEWHSSIRKRMVESLNGLLDISTGKKKGRPQSKAALCVREQLSRRLRTQAFRRSEPSSCLLRPLRTRRRVTSEASL